MKKLVDNRSHTWSSLGLFIYGLSLIVLKTNIRIIDFPPRFFLIVSCLLIPVLTIFSILTNRRKLMEWTMVAQSAIWGIIGVLYAVHPITNEGWVMSVIIVGFVINALYRGNDK